MSRSYRHTTIIPNGGTSEKDDKKRYNRKVRRNTRELLSTEYEKDDLILPTKKDLSNVWDMSKDGKHYLSPYQIENYCWYEDKPYKLFTK